MDVSSDQVQILSEKMDAMLKQLQLVELAIERLTTKGEESEKLNHESRIQALERTVAQWTGGKIMLLWLITTAIAVFAAIKH
ncbi:MAG: hypothetical protein H6Q69_198 [Firmicutes bacterium]|nr:hypothetical protein [Bacillota bacterium]